jgi:hypothetical protein
MSSGYESPLLGKGPEAGMRALGTPGEKSKYRIVDFLVVIGCLACFILSIYVITPNLYPSWRLGFNNQIVVVGFLLSIMNLCTAKLAPVFLFTIEATLGRSSLHNYEAIIRNAAFLSHVHFPWRATLLFFTLLPIGLSVGYKRFLGGSSTINIPSDDTQHYGLVTLPMGDFSVMNNSIYLMINSSVPFIAASESSSNDNIPNFPAAYGFNTLVLDNMSTALLDLPVPDNVSSIQQNLRDGEWWTMSASVDATVARYNSSISSYRDSDSFWTEAFAAAQSSYSLNSVSLYNHYQLGLLVGSNSQSPFCLMSIYNGSSNGLTDTSDLASPESISFRQEALKFEVQRERCAGTWKITQSSVELLGGSCTGEKASQDILQSNSSIPFFLDVLPMMAQWLTSYSPPEWRRESPWKMPSFTTAVSSMYWARMIYMNPYNGSSFKQYPSIFYTVPDEKITSTRATMQANQWGLYLILAVHPVLTIMILLALITLLYHTPISDGFGLVSVLAGIERDSLDRLQGAALSGSLIKPVSMHISVLEKIQPEEGPRYRRIQYSLAETYQKPSTLERKEKYG